MIYRVRSQGKSLKVLLISYVLLLVDNNTYVMKEIPFDDANSMELALQEKQNMSRVSHRNVCSYVDYFIAGGKKLYLIMEYCDHGDLDQYLTRTKTMTNGIAFQSNASTNIATSRRAEIIESKVWRFFIQICLALETIHD